MHLLPFFNMQPFQVIWLESGIQFYLYRVNHVCLLVLSLRPRRHPDPLKWRWSWSIWRTKSKTQSGRTRLVPMWRNAGWVFTTAIPSPRASTLPPPSSATARGDTQEMARSTATKREALQLNTCTLGSGPSRCCTTPLCAVCTPQTGATTSVVRASVAEAPALSANVPSAGRPTQPLWCSAGWSVTSTAAATSTPPV